ncbi:MAG: hypothetical protein ACLRFN_02435 [Alphaproteobacteria bacterium]
MKNAVIKVAFVVGLIGACGYLSYRLGGSVCRENVAKETVQIQQMVQESDTTITEKVLGSAHSDNLQWLVNNYKRAN